jgi:hypothetical protein
MASSYDRAVLLYLAYGDNRLPVKNKRDLDPIKFRPVPEIQDPGKNISERELQAEQGRLLVKRRIKNQGVKLAKEQERRGAPLTRLEQFLFFADEAGVSESDLAKAKNETEQIKLIQSGLEKNDLEILALTNGTRNDFNAGLAVQAAESLARFSIRKEEAKLNEPLLDRIRRGQAGKRSLILTGSAGVQRGPFRPRSSASGARTSQLGQPLGNQDGPRGSLFQSPDGLLENNLLGRRGELGV